MVQGQREPTSLLTLQGSGTFLLDAWGCPHGHPEGAWTSSFRDTLARPYGVLGLDVMIAVGLARFGLDLPEHKVQALFEDGCALPLVQSTISRLSTEFLVRWRMLGEERLPDAVRTLGGFVVPFDGTGDPRGGGRVTYRAREARHGLTLWADPLESESEKEVTRFYRTFREHYGVPLLGLRDDGTAAKKALARVFPDMPVGEDHQHFLNDLGPVILRDDEPLRQGLVGDDGLGNLTKWSHTLPVSDGVWRSWRRCGCGRHWNGSSRRESTREGTRGSSPTGS